MYDSKTGEHADRHDAPDVWLVFHGDGEGGDTPGPGDQQCYCENPPGRSIILRTFGVISGGRRRGVMLLLLLRLLWLIVRIEKRATPRAPQQTPHGRRQRRSSSSSAATATAVSGGRPAPSQRCAGHDSLSGGLTAATHKTETATRDTTKATAAMRATTTTKTVTRTGSVTWGTEDYRLLFGQTMEVMTVAMITMTFYSFFFFLKT